MSEFVHGMKVRARSMIICSLHRHSEVAYAEHTVVQKVEILDLSGSIAHNVGSGVLALVSAVEGDTKIRT